MQYSLIKQSCYEYYLTAILENTTKPNIFVCPVDPHDPEKSDANDPNSLTNFASSHAYCS